MNLSVQRRFTCFLLLALLSICRFDNGMATFAQAPNNEIKLPTGLTLELVTKGLDGPTAFTFGPEGRIYFTQKSGVVRVFQNNKLLRENFLDLSSEVNHAYNRGLVGITLHPDFPHTPYVYLAYVYQPPEANAHKEGGARLSRVVRVSVDPANLNQALPNSLVVLLGAGGTFEQIGNPDKSDSDPLTCQDADGKAIQDCLPVEGTAHQANMLRFGRDGALYVGVGDGGEHSAAGLRAQDINSLSGKILRVNPLTGAGYSNNPFYDGNVNSNRSRVFALGLRNPFRFTFHPTTGELLIGDVGNSAWEEVNRGRAGNNFGWPCFEGAGLAVTNPPCDQLQATPNRHTPPIHVFAHTEGRVAVVGGDFYTGAVLPTEYRNAYFFGDYNTGEIWTMTLSDKSVQVRNFATKFSGVVQISVGPDGALYILTGRGGTLYRIR